MVTNASRYARGRDNALLVAGWVAGIAATDAEVEEWGLP